MQTEINEEQLSDAALITKLSGFANQYTSVNNIKLHYVIGGQGHPLVLLPGWPETWWAYHRIMPLLARHFTVIALDLRGMGSSEKPSAGYEKKNMALDVACLVRSLGFEKVNIAGHDIGATVAHSFAAQFPELTDKVVLLDTPPLDENIYRLPMLRIDGVSTLKAGTMAYPWWIAFNQVEGLPEQLLEGRMPLLIEYIFNYVGIEHSQINSFDKQIYAHAYQSPEAIRAGNAWYKAFPQDVKDSKTYGKLTMPVMGLGGDSYEMLKMAIPALSDTGKVKAVPNGGHFLFEEQPQLVAEELIAFLK